jgi:hypothetical protein
MGAEVSDQRQDNYIVMAGLVPAIHAFLHASLEGKTWMPGTRPGMTFEA